MSPFAQRKPMTAAEFPPLTVPVQPFATSWSRAAGLRLSVLRADLVDPLLSGNKYFKLKYNLLAAAEQRSRTLLSFGGAWSNHLHALAAAGQRHGFATIGVVRGEPSPALNPCLRDLQAMGMRLHFVSRDAYRHRDDPALLAAVTGGRDDVFVIPEGAANRAGIRGCQELLAGVDTTPFSAIMLACGTGTTLAGLITSTLVPVLGIQILKGEGYLQQEVKRLLDRHGLQAKAPWSILDAFHFGGYARADAELLRFCASFGDATGIPLEPVYSGKLFMALSALVQGGYFPEGSHLLLVHGGGLQGRRGFLTCG